MGSRQSPFERIGIARALGILNVVATGDSRGVEDDKAEIERELALETDLVK
jgi:hypothetical protein